MDDVWGERGAASRTAWRRRHIEPTPETWAQREGAMPTISWFYGIAIRMFYNDHAPPHFHAFYGSREARVSIETGEIISGHLPSRQRRLVRQWTLLYHDKLMADWMLVRSDQTPERIPGLGA